MEANVRRRFMVVGALAALAIVGASCSSGPSGPSTTVKATLAENSITLDRDSAPAGSVTFDVRNIGVEGHDLIVIRTPAAPDSLPVHGSTASEEGSVGSTEILPAGEKGSLTVDLDPGAYVLICNVSEHYRAGMYVGFTVA
jgi:hypothetical protein